MGTSRRIAGFTYLPRQDGNPNGTVENYRFETSMDGTNWTTNIISGTFANIQNNPSLQEVKLARPSMRASSVSQLCRKSTEPAGRAWRRFPFCPKCTMGSDFPHAPALQLTQYCRLAAIVTGTQSGKFPFGSINTTSRIKMFTTTTPWNIWPATRHNLQRIQPGRDATGPLAAGGIRLQVFEIEAADAKEFLEAPAAPAK